MDLKGVSFSKYKVKINTYIFEKLSLFEFLFISVILDSKIDKNKNIKACLEDLDIKEDLHYLFNNVYYKLVDNLVIVGNVSEDISELKIKDITIDSRFVDYLNKGYFPKLDGNVTKEFIYDYLKGKIVLEKEVYDDSNVCVLSVDNSKEKIEKIINDNKKSLFDIDEGLCILEDICINPYYFKIDLDNIKDEHKEIIYNTLKNNSCYLTDKDIKGDFLSNNIYYECLYSKMDLKDYCDILFVYDKDKEFQVAGNVIYVGYEFKDSDYIDLKKKENYLCGKMLLKDNYISSYKKEKVDISEFKLYLVKNKAKFESNISKYIELF